MKLDDKWITGFVDGEGCFYVGINPHKEMTVGFQVLPEFTVVQHNRDVIVLHALKNHFDCGVVRKNHGDRMAYRVRSVEHLKNVIVPFFKKFPLVTKKKHDFKKFCEVLDMIETGDHLQLEGIEKIRAISSQMNRGQLR